MPASAPTWRIADELAHRPAVPALLFLIAGILAQSVLPPKPFLWLGFLLLLLAIAVWRLRKDWLCNSSLAIAVFLLGLTSAQLDTYFFPANHIALFTDSTERLAELELHIIDPPHLTATTAEMRTLPARQITTAEVTAIQTRTGWKSASGRVTLQIAPPLDSLAAGQTIRALGWLSRPTPAANPGQFDFAAHDRLHRILAEVRIRRSETVQFINKTPPPLARLRVKVHQLLADGFPAADATDSAFLPMLLFGDTDPRLSDVRDDFTLTGTAYLLSISGLHLAILGGSMLLLLRLFRVGPFKSLLIATIFITLYAALAMPSQTGIRALLMILAAAAGLIFRRSLDALQLLAVAVLAILIVSPADLYDTGFQIGVAAVAGLILFAPHVNYFFIALFKSDDPWADRRKPHKIPILIAQSLARRIWQTLLISSIIWVMIMPIVAYYFQQTNPWAVPAGILLLPITIVALLAAVGKILLTLICPPLAATWAAIAAQPAILLRHGVNVLAHLPGASVTTPPPPPWVLILYYALLFLPLIPWQKTLARRSARLSPVLACLLILVAPIRIAASIAAANPLSSTGGVHITFLSIGAGQTAIVRVQNGQTVFFDCGSSTIPDVYRRVIHPYLLHEGIGHIDGIFLSHGDYDHISAAGEIIADYHVPALCMTPFFRPHAVGSIPAQTLLHQLDTTGPAPTYAATPDLLNIGGGATLQILWPPPQCNLNSNDCGMVVKLIYAGRSILFPADIQVAPELELLKHPDALKSDVLIAPHHGSAETSTRAFVKAVDPKFIVCSSGRPLTHKQQVFDQLATPWPDYRTDQCGAIDVTISGDGKITLTGFIGATAEMPQH